MRAAASSPAAKLPALRILPAACMAQQRRRYYSALSVKPGPGMSVAAPETRPEIPPCRGGGIRRRAHQLAAPAARIGEPLNSRRRASSHLPLPFPPWPVCLLALDVHLPAAQCSSLRFSELWILRGGLGRRLRGSRPRQVVLSCWAAVPESHSPRVAERAPLIHSKRVPSDTHREARRSLKQKPHRRPSFHLQVGALSATRAASGQLPAPESQRWLLSSPERLTRSDVEARGKDGAISPPADLFGWSHSCLLSRQPSVAGHYVRQVHGGAIVHLFLMAG